MSAHTPGPWSFSVGRGLRLSKPHGPDDGVLVIHQMTPIPGGASPLAIMVETTGVPPNHNPTAIADARLIAASPSMYAALREIQQTSGHATPPVGSIADQMQSLAERTLREAGLLD